MPFMIEDSYRILLNYSFRLLARKAYTEAEVLERLRKRVRKIKLENAEPAVQKVLTRLRELNYIDDKKILENYFEYRLQARPLGKFRFLHEMYKRGIPVDKAKAEWEARNTNEKPLARALIEKKARLFRGLPAALKKKKIASMLASRGFAPDTIWGILEKM